MRSILLLTVWGIASVAAAQPDNARAQVQAGQALLESGLPVAASGDFASVLKAGPQSGAYAEALEGLLKAQATLDDEYLIPSLLASADTASIAKLPPASYARASYLLATIAQRKGDLTAARVHLEAIAPSSVVYAQARYLLGIVLVDPRQPGGAHAADALRMFDEVLAIHDGRQESLDKVHELATLARARTLYGVGRYAESVTAYEAVPRFSRYWDQALFENGFARFRNEDLGGALGSLQSLHAPQFEGSFLPESWILKGTIYFFSCLYEESKSALNAFDQVYAPMIAQLKPLATDKTRDPASYYALVSDPNGAGLPHPVYLWVRSNERLLGVFRLIDEIDREKKRAPSAAVVTALDENRATAVQVAGQLAKNRIIEAYKSLKNFSDQAEIIKFETTKAEKELVEQGVDQAALLASQRIYRPALPGSNWEYWKFDGEFWIDEIGYYQYTMRNGCPSRAARK